MQKHEDLFKRARDLLNSLQGQLEGSENGGKLDCLFQILDELQLLYNSKSPPKLIEISEILITLLNVLRQFFNG